MTSFADPGFPQSSGGEASRDVSVNLNADVSGYTQQVGTAQQATAGLTGSVDKLTASLGGLTKFAGKQLFHFAAADFAGLGAAVADAASLEHQLGTLRATATVTGTSMNVMSSQLDKAFTSFPVARQQIIQLAETITNLGTTAPRAVGSAVTTFTKLGAATGESPIGLATGQLQLNRMMGNTDPGQVDKYANSLLTVSKNQGVAASGVLDFAQAIAPMSRAAGIGEAAVTGISAAFQKAGADGAYAANAFNSVVTEMTRLKQTGSPEMAKYASFVGKGSEEFRAQSGTDQITQVFNQIAKGGPQANSFVESLGLGQRAVGSIQAVAQGGGLQQAIAQARGGTKDTENLDKAAETAFSGLSDSVIEVGNQFTKLGEILGGPFLKPLTMAAKVFGGVMEQINKVLNALGPLPGMAMALVGAMAIPAGIALTHFGATTALALGRSVMRGPTMAAFRAGRGAAGMTAAEAAAASAVGGRVVGGTASFRERAGFRMGQAGPAAGTGVFSRLGGVARSGFGGVLGAGTWAANMAGFRRAGEAAPPGLRESMRTGSVMGLAGAGARSITSTVREGSLGAANLAGSAAGAAARGVGVPGGVTSALGAGAGMLGRGLGAVAGAAFSLPGMLAMMVGVPLIGSLIDSMKETNEKKADFTQGSSGSSPYDQGLDRASTNLARFGDALEDTSDRLSKFATTPITQVGKVTAEDIGAVKGAGYEIADPKLRSVIEGATAAAAAKNGDQDAVAKAVGAYLDQQAIEAGGALTGDRVTKMKQDILSVMGIGGADAVTGIVTDFATRQSAGKIITPDFRASADLASRTGTDTERFKNIFGGAASSLVAGTQDYGIEGGKIQLSNLLAMGATAGGTAGEGQKDRNKLINDKINEQFKINPEVMDKALREAGRELGTGKTTYRPGVMGMGDTSEYTPFTNPEDAARVRALAFSKTPEGQQVLQTYGWDLGQLTAAVQNPQSLPQLEQSGAIATLQGAGAMGSPVRALGQFAAGSTQFLDASTGKEAASPGRVFQAQVAIASEAAKQSGDDYSKASSNLRTLAAATGGATGAMLNAAAAWADQQQTYRNRDVSPEQRLTNLRADAATKFSAANPRSGPPATPEQVEASRTATSLVADTEEGMKQEAISKIKTIKAAEVQQRRAAESNKLQIDRSNRDFAIQQSRAEDEYGRSRQHQIEDFGIQRVRSEQAYNLSVAHSQEDFATSQARAAQDYGKARMRAQEDYQTNSRRSLEDYQKNVNRQTADHLRDLERQAKAAASSIYDPFIRVQKKATTDAGTLIYNLKEQNQDIERQLQQIQELKDMGVSQNTVDTLKLGETGQDQQVSALLQSLKQNPNMTGEINALIEKRQSAAGRLTQSNDNVSFRQQEEDFAKSMARASEDFSTMQARAAEDQGKTMSRMAEDFGTTTARAAEDQGKALARMAEAFSIQQEQAAADQEKTLARQAEAFAITSAQAVSDHEKNLADLAVDYQRTQDQAAEDLAESFVQYNGTFTDIMAQLVTTAGGAFKEHFPAAADLIITQAGRIKAALTPMQSLIASAFAQAGPAAATPLTPGETPKPSVPSRPGGGGRFAFGGISLTQQQAIVGEHGPEAHIPLNSTGENFMAGLIARSLTQGVTTAISGGMVGGGSNINDNSISFAGADIQVVAQDPDAMARQLAGKAKLARLASPVRH